MQIRVEGGAAQAPKAVTEGLSSQQIDDVLKTCEAQEVSKLPVLCHLFPPATLAGVPLLAADVASQCRQLL